MKKWFTSSYISKNSNVLAYLNELSNNGVMPENIKIIEGNIYYYHNVYIN